jgi:hypothetical protein
MRLYLSSNPSIVILSLPMHSDTSNASAEAITLMSVERQWLSLSAQLSSYIADTNADVDVDFRHPTVLHRPTPGDTDECVQLLRALNEGRAQQLISALSFVVLGSDGLWDVIGPYEAVQMACRELVVHIVGDGLLSDDAFEFAARKLAVESLIRGSMDNIGVCVVDVSSFS